MAGIPDNMKGWQAHIREREAREAEKERLDIREDSLSAGLDANGDGILDDGDVHYSPDRKQDDAESRGKKEESRHEDTPHRGLRR